MSSVADRSVHLRYGNIVHDRDGEPRKRGMLAPVRAAKTAGSLADLIARSLLNIFWEPVPAVILSICTGKPNNLLDIGNEAVPSEKVQAVAGALNDPELSDPTRHSPTRRR